MSTTNGHFDWSDPRNADHWLGQLASHFYHQKIDLVVGWKEIGAAMAMAIARHISFAMRTTTRFSYLRRDQDGRERLVLDSSGPPLSLEGKRVLVVTDCLDQDDRATIEQIVEELKGVSEVEIGVMVNGGDDRFQVGEKGVRVTPLIEKKRS